jgi:hypothetical protein
MFLISVNLTQFLIVAGVIILFLGSFILNKRTKAPKGVELPEKCHSCLSNTCIVKQSDIDKIKEELRNCEEIDEKK